jgi:hypothetical protein
MPSLRSFLFLVLLAFTAHAGSADRTLDIYWIDVEGGGATPSAPPPPV